MTTYTSPHNLPVIEPNSDRIKDGAEASALAGDINALAMATNGALSSVSLDTIKKVFLGTGNAQFGDVKDLNTMPNGFVTVGDYLAAEGLGLPDTSTGVGGVSGVGGTVLAVAHSDTNAQQFYFTAHSDGTHIWSRKKTGSTWTSWQRTDSGKPPKLLPTNANLNTYYGDAYIGWWRVTSTASASTMSNLPLDSLGRQTTTVVHVTGPYGFQLARVYNADGPPLLYYRSRTTHDATIVDAWSDWVNVASGASSPLTNIMQDNTAKQDDYYRARGVVGTAGVGAVALRFDHNMLNFRDIVLPLLRARNLPWSLAVNTSQNHIDAPANGGVTWAQLQGWAVNDGGEILAHSHTHADSTSDSAIIANVQDSIPILKSGMPELVVEGFAVPGAGGTNWNGFLDTLTSEYFSTKYTGASAVLKNFAFCTGYIPGALRALDGKLTNGQTHITLDSYTTSSTAINMMQQAVEMGAGVQLMMHPNALTIDGRITTGVLTQILDWIVTERDAGRLAVLTTSSLLIADASVSRRDNILRGFNTAVWPTASGWTFAGNSATGTSSAGVMTGNVSLANLGHIRGRVRELVVEARASSGSVLRMGVSGGAALTVSKNLTVPAGTEWRTCRVPFVVPNSATSLVVSLGRVSGGALEMRDPVIRSV